MAVYFILYRFLYYHLVLNDIFVAFQLTQIPTISIICEALAENYCSNFLRATDTREFSVGRFLKQIIWYIKKKPLIVLISINCNYVTIQL